MLCLKRSRGRYTLIISEGKSNVSHSVVTYIHRPKIHTHTQTGPLHALNGEMSERGGCPWTGVLSSWRFSALLKSTSAVSRMRIGTSPAISPRSILGTDRDLKIWSGFVHFVSGSAAVRLGRDGFHLVFTRISELCSYYTRWHKKCPRTRTTGPS